MIWASADRQIARKDIASRLIAENILAETQGATIEGAWTRIYDRLLLTLDHPLTVRITSNHVLGELE
jgi:hypothetical protein